MEIKRELSTQEKIVNLSSTYLGLREIVGEEDNHIIMDMFSSLKHTWVEHDETGWCTVFINYILKKLDLEYSKELTARSYLDIGKETKVPVPGDIVVFWRESLDSWKGHVGIFLGFNASGNIFCLGGNQSNEINISVYNKDKILSFRTPQKTNK